jgi:hypothetical protein
VNQPTGYVQAEAQQPQNQKYSDQRPEHINLLFLPLFCFISLHGDSAERLPTFLANSLGPWSNQPAKRAHPL